MNYDIIASRTWSSGNSYVMAVAVKGHDNDWAAYIGAPIPNLPQENAVQFVAANGAKMVKREAFAIFPQVANWTDPETGKYLGYRE